MGHAYVEPLRLKPWLHPITYQNAQNGERLEISLWKDGGSQLFLEHGDKP